MRNPVRKFMICAPFKVSVVAAVCLGVFIVASARDPIASSPGDRGPVIRVNEKIHHLGEMNPWEMVEHTFRVFNDGESVLRIERVSPD